MLLICVLFGAVRFHYDAMVMRLYNAMSRFLYVRRLRLGVPGR